MLRTVAVSQLFVNLFAVGVLLMSGTPTARGQFTQNRDTVKVDVAGYDAEIRKDFRLFKEKCGQCHGLDLSLKTNMPPDRWTAEVKRMQAMASSRINDVQAKAIGDFLNYDEAHRKPPITTAAPTAESDAVSAGRKVYYAQGCDACHSIGGEGGPMPIDGVGTRLSREQILRRLQDRRAGAVMPPLPSDTSDQQINELVDFLDTLKK